MNNIPKINSDEFVFFSKSNEFRSEFLSPEEDAIFRLTGFSGSLGYLCIFNDEKVLFVDGRYTEQAVIETKCKVMQFQEVYSYIKSKKCKKVFIDTLKHTINEVQKLEGIFENMQICHHTYVKSNFESSIVSYPNQHRDVVLNNILITNSETVSWLLNIRTKDFIFTPTVKAFAYFETGKAYVFTDQKYADNLLKKNIKFHAFDDIYTFLEGKTFEADPNYTPYAFLRFNPILKKSEIPLNQCIKNNAEIKASIKAHKLEGKAFAKLYNFILDNKELTEIEIENKLEEIRHVEKSYKGRSFRTICATGKNATIIHYHANAQNSKKLEDLLLIDFGGQYLFENDLFEDAGATTDCTRTIAITNPRNFQKRAFTLVLRGHIALATAVFKSGATGADLDVLARQFLLKDFYDYPHGTGHGVGGFLNVHEGPCGISRNATTKLMEGMIISNEPGYYKDFGIRIESLMLVIKAGDFLKFETLTKIPIDLSLVDFDLLDNSEKKWLEDYNRECLELN